MDEKATQQIRKATQQNMALGNDKLKHQIEQFTKRRVTSLKPGPKSK